MPLTEPTNIERPGIIVVVAFCILAAAHLTAPALQLSRTQGVSHGKVRSILLRVAFTISVYPFRVGKAALPVAVGWASTVAAGGR